MVAAAGLVATPLNTRHAKPELRCALEDEVDAAALMVFCQSHIAGYKIPKGIDFQHEPLPKSGPGKVLKRELRLPYWENSDRQIH